MADARSRDAPAEVGLVGVAGILGRVVGRIPKYSRIFVRCAVAAEQLFRAFDDRRLRTFAGARDIPLLTRREGGHQAYSDWCFQSGLYAGLLGSVARRPLRVLDVGCGAGEIVTGALQALPDGSVYLGVDIDGRLVEQCRQTYRDPRASFTAISGGSPFYDAAPMGERESLAEVCGERRWDVIVVKAVFDHLSPKDAEAYLHCVSRGLAEGGLIIATFFVVDEAVRGDRASGRPARFRFDDVYPGHSGFRYSATFNAIPEAQLAVEAGRLSELLTAAGLQITRMLPGTWRAPGGRRGVDMPDTLVLQHRPEP